MPDDETTVSESVSRKAHERVVAERDELKSKAQELERAVRDMHRRDKLVEVFQHSQVGNPWSTANSAMRDIRFRDASDEELDTVASSWLEEIRSVVGAPAASGGEEEQATPAKPAQPAPWVAPNPASPGEATVPRPLVQGTPEYRKWAAGKTGAEKIAAMRSGEVVPSQIIQQSQDTINR